MVKVRQHKPKEGGGGGHLVRSRKSRLMFGLEEDVNSGVPGEGCVSDCLTRTLCVWMRCEGAVTNS